MNFVTVIVGSQFPLRQEEAGMSKSINFGSFPAPDETGKMVERFFKNEIGEPDGLSIVNVLTLNKKDPIDAHNLEMLKLMLKTHPQLAEEIMINDSEEAAEIEAELSDKSFEIEAYIRDNRTNNDILAKLHRRVIGPVQGLTSLVVFNALIGLAKQDPKAFIVREDYVYNDRSFEVLSLIDACIEKGILTVDIGDGENLIRYRDGHIMAESLEKAAFYLSGHPEEMDTLYRLLDDRIEKPLRYNPKIESSPNVELSEATAKEATSPSALSDDQYLEHISETIPKMVEAKVLVKSGQGIGTRYVIFDLPDNQFMKRELIAFFKNNPAQFEDLKVRAKING